MKRCLSVREPDTPPVACLLFFSASSLESEVSWKRERERERRGLQRKKGQRVLIKEREIPEGNEQSQPDRFSVNYHPKKKKKKKTNTLRPSN